jgi:hypothetical protein
MMDIIILSNYLTFTYKVNFKEFKELFILFNKLICHIYYLIR